jgi:hypothetical protein
VLYYAVEKNSSPISRHINANIVSICAVVIAFFTGTLFTDYQYKDIPRIVVVEKQATIAQNMATNLLSCIGNSKQIIVKQSEMMMNVQNYLQDTKNLNKGILFEADRVQDILNTVKQQAPFIEAINTLQ